MYKLILFLIFSFIILQSCKEPIKPKYTETITVSQVDSIITANENIILLDVRTPEEFEEGSIPDARNIDVKNDSFEVTIQQLDTLDTYLVFCRSGMRSLMAIEKMENLGFRYIYNLDGGYLAWSDEK